MQVKMKKQKKKTTGILNIEEQALEQLDSHVNELKQKEVELTQESQVKKFELDNAEKRLESFQHSSSQHQSELMQLENDLSVICKIYVEKIRNQAYLQNRLHNFQKYEETRQNSLKGIIERNEERGNKILSDGVEIQADVPKMIQNQVLKLEVIFHLSMVKKRKKKDFNLLNNKTYLMYNCSNKILNFIV